MMDSTVSSRVCAEAPGYTADTRMVGGATVGYCAIGSLVIDTVPSTSTKSAITHAKTGRSMKNLAIARPYFFAADAGADAGAPGAPPCCHGTALTGAPGRIFWK